MWTLSTIRNKLQDRLSDDSGNFWSDDDLDSYINEAQTRIAAITGGVPQQYSESVGASGGNISFAIDTLSPLGPIEPGAHLSDGTVLNVVTRDQIDRIWPGWRTFETTNNPKWVVLDIVDKKAYVVPGPTTSITVNLDVAVIPAELTTSSDELYGGADSMEKFQGATLNLATSLALLKERYDQDAERFFQWFRQEMVDVGIDPSQLPNVQQVRQEGVNG